MKVSIAAAYSLHALMYMVRHITQLPATTNTIAKAEGIPPEYLSKIFQQLVKAGFVKAAKDKKKDMFLLNLRKISACSSYLNLSRVIRYLPIVCCDTVNMAVRLKTVVFSPNGLVPQKKSGSCLQKLH